jgi:copper oxidase (laccase) domain-containing protein
MKHVIGALHVGWRGVLAGGIEEFFAVMNREWNCNAKDILIGAAPSLCKTCAEFTDPAKELPGISEGFTEGRCVDLVGIANKKLQDLGVLPAHTERMTGCTKCQSEEFWSYRGPDREKVMVGARNVLGIQLR